MTYALGFLIHNPKFIIYNSWAHKGCKYNGFTTGSMFLSVCNGFGYF